MSYSSKELSAISQQAMQLLGDRYAYTQSKVVGKLEHLGYALSEASFSNIMKDKGTGKILLLKVADGLREIMKKELGMEWVGSQFVKTAGEDFEPEIIPTALEASLKTGFILHDKGRLSVADKVAFFQAAQHEVVEFGVKLNRFTHNLYSGGYDELKGPIATLLERGVHFKCYMIDPVHNNARLYFLDRELCQPSEQHFEREIKDNMEKLRAVQAELAQAGFPGRFEVFTYNHVPYNYFLAVDGGTEHCKMMVSHYLYGIPRNQSPVLEFSKKQNFMLYRRYWDSLTALTKNAKLIIPS